MNTLPLSHSPVIRRTNLAQAVAQEVQALIARERLAAGSKLPSEREMAEALGVGRPAVREGLRLLQGLGIVQVVHGKGVFLNDVQLRPLTDLTSESTADRWELLRQVTEARRAIDVEAARSAATGLSGEAERKLRAYLADCEREPLRTKRRFGLDLGFEQRLCEATANSYLMALQRVAHQMFVQAWETAGFIPRPAEERQAQHEEILAAVLAGNSDLASAAMASHVSFQIPTKKDIRQ